MPSYGSSTRVIVNMWPLSYSYHTVAFLIELVLYCLYCMSVIVLYIKPHGIALPEAFWLQRVTTSACSCWSILKCFHAVFRDNFSDFYMCSCTCSLKRVCCICDNRFCIFKIFFPCLECGLVNWHLFCRPFIVSLWACIRCSCNGGRLDTFGWKRKKKMPTWSMVIWLFFYMLWSARFWTTLSDINWTSLPYQPLWNSNVGISSWEPSY